MIILFENAVVLLGGGKWLDDAYVAVDGEKISYVGKTKPEGNFDRKISCKGKMLSPAFYNIHAHAAMTLFRGIGEDLPLDRWLSEKIYPAEDRLSDRSVRLGSMLSIAEMIREGCVSFTDMYFFCDQTAEAVIETGVKANISRCIVSFDPTLSAKDDYRFKESVELVKNYHNAADGRVKIDMSVHAEYTNQESYCREVAAFTHENDLNMHVHVSETEKEHEECKARHNGMTPTEFLCETGILIPSAHGRATAAHCVYVSKEDRALLRENKVAVAHNPVSNLKLASGVADVRSLLDDGVLVGLGTDGAASNNAQSVHRELQLASILHKGITRKADVIPTYLFHDMATKNGAVAQGREDCGKIAVGNRADLMLYDLTEINNIPYFDPYAALAFSTDRKDNVLTMCDGKILYENGEYQTIDIERLRAEAADVIGHYFD